MDREELTGKTAVITGGASGIARGATLQLAALGASIAIVDINDSTLKETVDELAALGSTVMGIHADVAEVGSLPGMVSEIVERYDSIDILVNAAGITLRNDSVLTLEESVWDRTHAVNVKAQAFLMRHVGTRMIEQGSGGRIVNVSSSSAFRGQSPPAYGSSKAAIVQLTRTAAYELGPYNINVNAVVPGLTVTPMTLPLMSVEDMQERVRSGPLANFFGRVSEPDDVAAIITFLCTSASRQITGQAIHTSAGAVV